MMFPSHDLGQGTPEANFCDDRYAEIRDWLLESHPWNFAVKRAKLNQTANTPVIKFDYEYTLPTDYIRAVAVYSDDEGLGIVDHKIENGKVLSSASEVWLLYVAKVTDPNKMSPLFREALASAIAVEAATNLVESNTLYDLMQRDLEKAIRRARSADAQSDLPDRLPVGTWVTGS